MPDDAILGMIADPRNEKKLSWFETLRGRPGLEGQLVVWPDANIRADLAFTYGWAQGSLARRTQELLTIDSSEKVRKNMARTTSFRDLFELLLADSHPAVRGSCAENPRIDRDQMERLITDPSRRVRVRAVSSGMRYPDEEQLLRLASDKSSAVRWEVLFNFRSPRDAIKLITKDQDDNNRRHAEKRLERDDALYSQSVIDSWVLESERATPGDFDAM